MKKMMLKYLPDAEAWIDEFIGETTGIQTILQMKGFVAELKRRGRDERVKYVLRQGGNVKNFVWKRSLDINADSADVFGRASGVQGSELP